MSWGTGNYCVLQPLNVWHHYISRIMAFSSYSCHVTPLYKNLNVLKLNDIYRLEWAKLMHKLHHGALLKMYDNYFQNVSSVHSYKTRFPDNENYFIQRVSTNFGKKGISFRRAALWKEIEQSLKTLLCVTFCRQHKDHLLNYK